MAYTLPMLYEKYEDEVDVVGEKALIEIKKQYAVFDEKVLSKIPMLSDKKQHWNWCFEAFDTSIISSAAQHMNQIVSFGYLCCHHLATF